jgi:hypothetical protein
MSGVTTTATSPTHPYIRRGAYSDPTQFLSLLISDMFAGKRTQPEILTMLSYLGSCVTAPSKADMQCLLNVFEYIKGTLELGLFFKPNSMQLYY